MEKPIKSANAGSSAATLGPAPRASVTVFTSQHQKRRPFSITQARRALKLVKEEGYEALSMSFHADGSVKIEIGKVSELSRPESSWDKALGNG